MLSISTLNLPDGMILTCDILGNPIFLVPIERQIEYIGGVVWTEKLNVKFINHSLS